MVTMAATSSSVAPCSFPCLGRPPVRSWCRVQRSRTPMIIRRQNDTVGFRTNQNLPYCSFVNSSIIKKQTYTSCKNMNMIIYCGNIDPGGQPLPSDPSSAGSWKLWIFGVVLSIIIPFWRNKWVPLLRLRKAVETAEQVVEMVETVAEGVEKVAEEVAEQLPEGGKLKGVVTLVEEVAKETAKDAHLAAEFIDKVEEVEKGVEAIMDQVSGTGSETNDVN